MGAFSVDSARCKRDGICAAVCPLRIIQWESGGLPTMRPELEKRCIRCGQCMAFCASRACGAPELSADELQPLSSGVMPGPEQVEQLFFYRRSIRNFMKKPVDDTTLFRMLDAARYAPSGQNRQSVRWVVIQGRTQVCMFADVLADWCLALAHHDPELAALNRSDKLARAYKNGVDIFMRGAPQLIVTVADKDNPWSVTDGVIALTYAELAGAASGVGACWAGYFIMAAQHPTGGAVRELLGVSDTEVVCGGQMIGYPVYKPFFRPVRNPLQVTKIEVKVI